VQAHHSLGAADSGTIVPRAARAPRRTRRQRQPLRPAGPGLVPSGRAAEGLPRPHPPRSPTAARKAAAPGGDTLAALAGRQAAGAM